jgi:hypothetical protein
MPETMVDANATSAANPLTGDSPELSLEMKAKLLSAY